MEIIKFESIPAGVAAGGAFSFFLGMLDWLTDVPDPPSSVASGGAVFLTLVVGAWAGERRKRIRAEKEVNANAGSNAGK